MISVICPTHNRARLLGRCLDALAELPAGVAEVIVVDDGSTDDTPELCRKWSAADPHYRRYLRLDLNQGAPVARNRGLAEARGNYILFVDSDDVISMQGVENLREELHRRPDLDFIHGKVLRVDERLRPLWRGTEVGGPYGQADEEVAGYHWHTMGALYRKTFLERVGPWRPDLTGSQDWEYQARVKLADGTGLFFDEIVGYWRHHQDNRVGTNRFRPDYVESVMKACASILQHATQAGRDGADLRRRLVKRLILHACEWGGHGRTPEKFRCLMQAREILPAYSYWRIFVWVFAHTPRAIDRTIYEFARALRQ